MARLSESSIHESETRATLEANSNAVPHLAALTLVGTKVCALLMKHHKLSLSRLCDGVHYDGRGNAEIED